ncbi:MULTISPECIES: DUF6489 family protein [Zhongshania]|jgi:hypothetical protein|uniref:Uncharacterized protein n=1 Tax=Zhongshania antarctica TaxID=641702 RepID=A0A840R0D3_9GAMM|nr:MULTISPECIES: DUF6489 family protein [Zhongshania]MBB5186034.1 hypothetical protein [Zhongshania antarctica]
MKVHLEIEISPEEMRRLVGLPDAQPLWDAVYKRIGEGDTEMVQQMAKTAFTEGMKTLDLSARVLKSLSGLATNRKSADKTTDKPSSEANNDKNTEKTAAANTTSNKAEGVKSGPVRRSASSKSKA